MKIFKTLIKKLLEEAKIETCIHKMYETNTSMLTTILDGIQSITLFFFININTFSSNNNKQPYEQNRKAT